MDSPLLDKSSPTFSQERWTTAKGSIYSLDYLIVLLAAKAEGHSLTSMLFTLHSSLVVSVNIRKSVGSHTVPRIHWGLYQCNISTCPPPRALQELIFHCNFQSFCSGQSYLYIHYCLSLSPLSLPTAVPPEDLFSHELHHGLSADSSPRASLLLLVVD